MIDPSLGRNPLEALAEEFLERFRRGERPALSEYTQNYPTLADEIRDLFPALVMLENVRPTSTPAPRPSAPATRKLERLGDYRILREIGRGGMGIVYEAEQESLGRHVALKVLPAHALLEPRHLERFQREARSAARLHHTNIVPVFGVGEEDGLHYYVMQFIHGQALDQVLAVMQRLRQHTRGVPAAPVPAASSADMESAVKVANLLLTGVFAAAQPGVSKTEIGADPAEQRFVLSQPTSDKASSPTGLPVALSSSHDGQPYWQSVARIGIQAAEALAYAHGQGTLHRDIKPANLLLDTQGIVWVTDFGLAKAADSDNLTNTGDVVGTLRYMAPERFHGKADGRSDVYGLGLTLYELLTLEPAYDASERDRLLLQVMHKEPARPRKLNPAVPRDLETVVLKAIARDPAQRYQSAAELAADLQRFTEDKPIQARPVSEAEKLWRWCRRNPSLATLASLFVLSLVIGLAGIGWKWQEAESQRKHVVIAEEKTRSQRDDAIAARQEGQQVLAGAMLDRGIALAAQGEVGEGLWWMLQGLRTAPPTAADLKWTIRANLAAWLDQTHRLEQFVEEQAPIHQCVFGAGGRRLLTGDARNIRVWDGDTGQPIDLTFEQAGRALALSPDGKILVAGGRGGKVQRRDAATGAPIGEVLAHPQDVRAARFAPDGKVFATAGNDGVVRLWDSVTGRLVRDTFRHPGRAINEIAISPDGKTLAAAAGIPDQDHVPAEVRLWDLAGGERIGTPLPHEGRVNSVAFAPGGTMIATGSADRTARLWDVRSGKPLGSPLRHSHAVTVVRFTPDGRMLVTGGSDGIIRWWDAATGTPLIGTLALPTAQVTDLAFRPDGKVMAAVSANAGGGGTMRLFRLARALARPPVLGKDTLAKGTWQVGEGESWLGRYQVSYSPDTALVLTGLDHGRARLWDAATGEPRLAPGGPDGPLWNSWPAVAVNAVSPDGRLLATSSRDRHAVGEVRLWDAATGRPIGAPMPHANYVSALAFSPDSRTLATGCYDRTVQLWDTATAQRRGAMWRQPAIVLSLAFSPDGTTLAVGHSHDANGKYGIVLWNVADRKPVVPAMSSPSHLIQFSPDGKRLLASAWSRLQFWDTATGQNLSPLGTDAAEINSAVFSADGSRVLLAMTDGTVRLRVVPSGKPIGAPMRHPFRANLAVFGTGSAARLILAGYDDGSARLWDQVTQKPIGPPMLHGARVISGAFAPDGRSFVTTSADGQPRRWPVPVPAMADVDQLTLRVQAHTGLTMGEEASVDELDAPRWQECQTRLLAHPSEPAGTSDVDFHDARARDAERDGDRFAARWHLDRLIAAQGNAAPTAWLAYARRGRTWTTEHRDAEADADYTAAIRHGAPDRLIGWYRYRIIECLAAKDSPAALWYLERAVALAPADWHLYADRARALQPLGKSVERDADLDCAAEHGAESTFLAGVADEYAGRGLWDKAARSYALADARGPLDIRTATHHALVLLKRGETDAYRRLCRRALEQEGATLYPGAANNLAWICALGPGAVADFAQPVALAESAVRRASATNKHTVLNTLGAVLYRAGRYKEALARLTEAIAADGHASESDHVFLAMVQQRLGATGEARSLLAKVAPSPAGTPFSWNGLEMELLRREAALLIDGAAR